MKKNLIKRITSKTLIDIVISSKFPLTEGEILSHLNFKGYPVYNVESVRYIQRKQDAIHKKLIDLKEKGILKTRKTGKNQTVSYDITKQYLRERNKYF